MKNKKNIWIIGSLITLLFLGILAATMANSIIAKLAPDKYVLLSILEMQKLSEKENNNKLHPKNRKTNIDLNIKEINGAPDDFYKEILEGSGIFLSIANSSAGNIMIDTGFKKNETSLVDFSIYSSCDQLGIKIPGLLEQYIMVDLAQFKQKYDQSGLAYFGGDIEQDDVDVFNHSVNLIRDSINGEGVATDVPLNNEIKRLVMDLAKKIKVKHTGTKKVTINQKQKKANQFAVTIDAKDLKHFAKDITATILKDIKIKDNIRILQDYFSTDEIEREILSAIDQTNFSDIEMILKIDNKKRIVTTELLTTLEVDGEKIMLDSNYILSGGDNIFDILSANFILDSISENQKVEFSFEKNLTAKEDNFKIKSSVMPGLDSNLSFNLSGNILTTKDANETGFDVNKVEVEIKEYGETFSLIGMGAVRVQDLKDEGITLTNAQQLDLFSIGRSEMLDIIVRVGSQFYQLNNMFN